MRLKVSLYLQGGIMQFLDMFSDYVEHHINTQYRSFHYSHLNWEANVDYYPNLRPAYSRFREWLDDDAINVVVMAGPQTINSICESLCDWAAQYDCGYPVPLKLLCAFCEPIFTEEGAKSCDALKRIHRYIMPYHYVADGRWKVESNAILKGYKSLIEKKFKSLQQRYPQLKIPDIIYGNAGSDEGRARIEEIAQHRVAHGRRPFDMVISGPNRYWVPRWMRRCTGEISVKSEKTGKYELFEVEIRGKKYYTNGACYGLHPVECEGDRILFSEYAGCDPIQKMIDQRMTSGCLALFGLAGNNMDDDRLVTLATGTAPFGLPYPKNCTEQSLHAYGQTLASWVGKQVPHVMFGDFTRDKVHLGKALVERIEVLFDPQLEELRRIHYNRRIR